MQENGSREGSVRREGPDRLRVIRVEEDLRIHEMAAEIKCERAISFVDCYTFAVAEATGSRPVFASEEAEIAKEMKKNTFQSPPVFL